MSGRERELTFVQFTYYYCIYAEDPLFKREDRTTVPRPPPPPLITKERLD